MKIRVYSEGLESFIKKLTGYNSKDTSDLLYYLEVDSYIYTYDDFELLQNLVEPSTGKGSHVSLFRGDPFGVNEWTLVTIESVTKLMALLRDAVESEELVLQSGRTELDSFAVKEASPRSVNVVLAKFPKFSGFTGDQKEIQHLYDYLEENDEYVANNDSEVIINFILGRHDNLDKFYISFEEDYTQVSVLSPSELAAIIEEILEDLEIENQ